MASARVPAFLDHTHKMLIDDVLSRMYLIVDGNKTVPAKRCPKGTEVRAWPLYTVTVGGREVDITGHFVDKIRTKLEYENSSSVVCHEAKKTYASLTHIFDPAKGDLTNVSVKVRGLTASKIVRSASDAAMADAFISCVMRGDCLRLEPVSGACFTTVPWHGLVPANEVAFCSWHIDVDQDTGLWLGLDGASTVLSWHRVIANSVEELDTGYTVSVFMQASFACAHVTRVRFAGVLWVVMAHI